MDRKLIRWGLRRQTSPLPRLWLFTDDQRLQDPRASVAGLPRGRAGVILRHDRDSDRTALGRDLARICRERRLVLVVAGDTKLAVALKAGVHLRGGRWPSLARASRRFPNRFRFIVTSSAHSIPELRRACRAGAGVVFLSPAFPTASHPNGFGLGPLRWAAMARHAHRGPGGARLAALGGVDGANVNRLPARFCEAVGAITGLSADAAERLPATAVQTPRRVARSR